MKTGTVCDLYCRVSTTEQSEEGYSLGEQESRLRSFADAHGWVINACYIDPGFTGSKLERPGIQSVIRDAKAHKINKVVTYKLDRLSRSQKDTLYLIEDVFLKNEVDYVSMTESFDTGTPFGRAVIGILSVFAQLEREQIKERMSMGRMATVKDGNWRGGGKVPFGYRYAPGTGKKSGTIVPDEMEALAVNRMFDLFLQGHTYSSVLRHIQDEFVLPGRGRKNKGSWVSSVMRNRIYIGEMLFHGEYYKGNFEPIVPPDVFWAVQKKLSEYQDELDSNRRLPQHRGHLLTGFTYCGCCGARVNHKSVPHTKKDGTLTTYRSYVCYSKQRAGYLCPESRQWRESDLEDAVLSQVESLQIEDASLDRPETNVEIQAMERRLSTIARQQEKLVELFSLGTIPLDAIQKQSVALAEEQKKLESRIELLHETDRTVSDEKFRDAVSMASNIRSLSEKEQRDLLRVLIKRITIFPDKTVEVQWNV